MSIRLAQHYRTEVVSADARQFYRELKIGVGRPTAEQLEQVPHHFIGHLSIHQPYSAGAYERDALALLERLFVRYPLVVLTGGSGLFLRAVTEGLDRFPAVPPQMVQQLQEAYQQKGLTFLQQELLRCDPDYLERVDRNNPQRLLRALSVCYASGKPYSSFLKGRRQQRPFRIIKIALEVPREELRKKINKRIDHMLQQGWLEEARQLYPWRHLTALRTVGYPQLFRYLEGNISWEETVASIRQQTWHYARRQMTWLRSEPGVHFIRPEEEECIHELVRPQPL